MTGICICRKVSDGLTPGARLGFGCTNCKAALQVSSRALQAITAGALIPFCETCGVAAAQTLEAMGNNLDVLSSPFALRQAARKPEIVPEYLQSRIVRCEVCRQLVKVGEAHACPGKGAHA